MRCVTIYETATDIGTGGSATTFTINPHANIKSRKVGGIPHLVSVSARFIATVGDGDSRQSTDTIITVSRTRTDTSDVTGTAVTNRGDWNTILEYEDRTAATGVGTNDSDYDYIASSPIPWSEDESLTVGFAKDTLTAAVVVCVSTKWLF